MALHWNGAAALARAQNEAAARLLRAAVFYQTYLMQRINVSNPRPYKTPSKPGEYFRKRTGWAQAHVLLSATTISDIIAQGLRIKSGVPQNAPYPIILEQSQRFRRLGFLQAMKDTAAQIRAILQSPAGPTATP